MTDVELLKITLNRLNMTYKEAAALCGMGESTFKNYGTGLHRVKPIVWRALLEHEAKAYQRQQDIAEMARGLGSSIPDPHAGRKRRGRPRTL